MLRADDMCVDSTDRGDDGLDIARHHDYDVIVLDLRLPDMSGFEVVRSLRAAKVQTPVIILSGSATVEDKIKALKAGADDYLTKTFRAEELTACLRTLVRRSKGLCDARICIGPMTLDLAAKTLEAGGRRISLSALICTCGSPKLGRLPMTVPIAGLRSSDRNRLHLTVLMEIQ